MKDFFGYTVRKNEDGGSDYYLHEYLVDGFNVKGDPSEGLYDMFELDKCPTKRQALNVVRLCKDKYDKIDIWDQWVQADLDHMGWPSIYSTVKQKVSTYVKGKLVREEVLL